MRIITIVLFCISSVACVNAQAADAFPQRPIRLVVPVGAGGNTDTFARILAEKLRAPLGQQIIVDNRPGADGIVGSEIVARANADGHTLLMAFPTHPVNPFLHAKLPYDTEKDFAPISMITSVTQVLLVNPKVAAKTVKELIALANDKPGALNSGAVARGSLGDLCTELFEAMSKIQFTHISYKGAPQVMTALIAGEVQVYFAPPVVAIPQVKAARVRALGVSTKTRLASLPEVPTIAESGLPGYDVVGWNGILAPAKTPRGDRSSERCNRAGRALARIRRRCHGAGSGGHRQHAGGIRAHHPRRHGEMGEVAQRCGGQGELMRRPHRARACPRLMDAQP